MPARLSGGQAHRVALGRLLLARCDALLLDEPYTGLDAHLRRALTDLVVALVVARDVPAVLVAHELADAQAFADRLAILDRGQLLQIGAPDEVVLRPASRRAAELVGYLGFVPVDDLSPGAAPVVAGVHPERVVPGPTRTVAGPERRRHRRAGPPGPDGRPIVRVAIPSSPAGLPDRPPAGGFEHVITLLDPPYFAPAAAGHAAARAVPTDGRSRGTAAATVRPAEPEPVPGSGSLRQARGYSQQQLARIAGVSRQAVSAVESGASDPSLRVALALSRALGLTVEEIFGPGTPEPGVEARPLAPLADGAPGDAGGQSATASSRCRCRAPRPVQAGFVPPRAGRLRPARPPVRPLGPPRPTLVMAGCDPAMPLLEVPLGLLDPPVSFMWWQCASGDGAGTGCTGLGARGRGTPAGRPGTTTSARPAGAPQRRRGDRILLMAGGPGAAARPRRVRDARRQQGRATVGQPGTRVGGAAAAGPGTGRGRDRAWPTARL